MVRASLMVPGHPPRTTRHSARICAQKRRAHAHPAAAASPAVIRQPKGPPLSGVASDTRPPSSRSFRGTHARATEPSRWSFSGRSPAAAPIRARVTNVAHRGHCRPSDFTSRSSALQPPPRERSPLTGHLSRSRLRRTRCVLQSAELAAARGQAQGRVEGPGTIVLAPPWHSRGSDARRRPGSADALRAHKAAWPERQPVKPGTGAGATGRTGPPASGTAGAATGRQMKANRHNPRPDRERACFRRCGGPCCALPSSGIRCDRFPDNRASFSSRLRVVQGIFSAFAFRGGWSPCG